MYFKKSLDLAPTLSLYVQQDLFTGVTRTKQQTMFIDCNEANGAASPSTSLCTDVMSCPALIMQP